jgi:SAM-dependent methyltransferase
MTDVHYDAFLSRIYDDAPYFGQNRSREPDLFNGFYFEHLRDKTRRILELGSATGMLTIPLARAGFLVDSVDISPFMHEVLGERLRAEDAAVAGRVRQILADATTYRADEPYDSIVMPEGVMLALGTRELQLALLDNCHRNLRPGGRIYADLAQPRYKLLHEQTLQEHTRFRTRGGDDYLLSVTFRYDRYSQIETWNAMFARQGAGPRSGPGGDPAALDQVDVELSFRTLFHSEIELMLERCGFRLIDLDVNLARGLGFAVIAEKR